MNLFEKTLLIFSSALAIAACVTYSGLSMRVDNLEKRVLVLETKVSIYEHSVGEYRGMAS